LSEAEKAAKVLGFAARAFDARSLDDLLAAFAAMAEWRADGLITLPDGMLYSQRERVVTLARDGRLAGVYPETGFVEAGGLVSYGPSLPDLFRRAASYVGKILQGGKAGRHASRAAHQIRTCHQPKNSARARTDDQSRFPPARRRGDRMIGRREFIT